MANSTVFIVNPAAAHGRVGRRRGEVERRIREAVPAAVVRWTEGPGDAIRIAVESDREDIVVACGGDGTVHEVATGLVRAGSRAALAVLGLGTGNDLARALGMGRGLAEGLAAMARARLGRMDYFRLAADDREFRRLAFNNVGVGFDAHASALARRYKRLPGSLGYTVGILHGLATWKAPEVVVRGGSGEVRVPLMFVTLGNGHSSGGGYLVTPDASPFDGLIDACVVRRLGVVRAVAMMPRTRRGDHGTQPEVVNMRSDRFSIECAVPVPVHCDGEDLPGGCRRLDVEIVPAGLAVFAPVVASARGDRPYLPE